MEAKLREGRKSDLSEILRLNGELANLHSEIDDYFLPGSETREATRKWLNPLFRDEDSLILVLEKDQGLGGYFIGIMEETKPFVRPAREGRISDAYLEPEFRGKGFAGRAMEKLKEWFEVKDVSTIRLSVHSKNQVAIRAWQSLGFEEYMKRMKLEV